MGRSAWSKRKSANKVWLVCDESGDSPVAEFVNALDDRTLTETAELFDWTEVNGPPRNEEKFKSVGSGVFEFKVHRAKAIRYLAVRRTFGWLIVLAENKKKSNAFQSDIKRAKGIAGRWGGE